MAAEDSRAHAWFMERRYLSILIVLIFIVLSVVSFFICRQQYLTNRELSLKEDRKTAYLLSLLMDQRLKRVVAVMESYSHRPLLFQAVRDKDAAKAVMHLADLVKRDPDIDILVLTDKQGTLWAAYPDRPEILGQNLAHREWYKGVSKAWKPDTSDVVQRIVREKDLAIQISVPFFDEKGEVTGIMVSTTRTVVLGKLVTQLPFDPGASISITDRKGHVVYSSRYDYEKEIKAYPYQSAMHEAVAAKNKTFAVDAPDFGGRKRYISYAPVGDIGWTVFIGRDKQSIIRSGLAFYIQIAVIALLTFLAIILFLAYSRKQIATRQIQEQLLAEKAIRAGEKRYQSYIDVTMQLAWTANHKGELVEDNSSWSKYTGRSYEETKGFGWLEDVHPDDRDRTAKIWRKAVAEKVLYETEYRLRRYDGEYRDYLARGIPLLDENGDIREWVGACIDISDRKEAEEKLRLHKELLEKEIAGKTGELQARISELERFHAATVAREFRIKELNDEIARLKGEPS